MILIIPMLYASLLCCTIFFGYIVFYKAKRLSPDSISTPEQALALLLQGNKEYNSTWNFISKANRKSVAMVQRPFAIVLSCSDSRVPTEIIFNQLNLGNMFIIRNAGNVVDGVVLGSIEFGVDQLGAMLVIVLGHERCGAVIATIDSIIENKCEPAGHIKDIINAIKPAAYSVLKNHDISGPISDEMKTEIIKKAVQENVKLIIQDLHAHSSIIDQAVSSGKIKVVGAFYDLDDGNVQIIP